MSWSFGRYIFRGAAATAGVLDALTKRPGHDADLPLAGCPVLGDCREFGCAGYCSEAEEELDYSNWLCPKNCDCGECYHNPKRDCHCYTKSSADFQRGQRIGSAEPPAGVEEHPPVSPPAGPTWVDWAEPAIWTALTPHEPSPGEDGYIWCYHPDDNEFDRFDDWQEWREHVGKLIAAHLENAHKLNVRDGLDTAWGPSLARQLYPTMFRKK